MNDPIASLRVALSDRYRVERELGQGGMATVYLAHDLKHQRDVAIKVLHPDLGAALGGERFLSEIRTTARLQHPHILPLLDSGVLPGEAGQPTGCPYYVMPLMSGETLRARLDRERQLPVDDALRIAREVADALGHAHELGIIHRDIKPENILLQGGHALVADFGIALAVQTAGGQRMTQTGLSLGTPQYMSPEQAMGERTIDARSDIYALGAVTYEMLAGEAPFTGPSVQAIVARVMSEEPRGLTVQRKAVPPAVEHAVMRALEKLPADRFGSAAEFAAALGSTTVMGTRASGTWAAPRNSRRGALIASGVAGLMAAAALWGWLRPQPSPQVVRYRISLDSVQSLRQWTGELAISPDGATLVHAGGVNGPLLVRHRDALDFVALPGTEGAGAPFFSPDGSQLGYIQNGKLLVAPLSGGPPVLLDDSLDTPETIAWAPDGTLYRAYRGADGQFSMGRSAATPGATVEPFTTLDSAAGELDHMLPDLLPNGKSMLLQVSVIDGRRFIASADLKTGQHTVLFEGARARYIRTGHILYSTMDGSLWVVPFDQDALAVTGPPALVSTGLPGTMVGPVNFAISESGTLVYALESPTARRELVWVGRDGQVEPFDTTWRAAFANPRLSPDGRRLAIVIREASSSHIWIRNVAGGLASKLSLGTESNEEPAWEPNGRTVTYVSDVGDVWRRAVDGGASAVRQIHTDRRLSEQVWSPDGSWLVVRTSTPTLGSGDIMGFRTTVPGDSALILSSRHTEYTPTISPDGRWMAYSSFEAGRQEIFVVPFPVPGTLKWQISTQGGMAPSWSPRGDEIFYLDQSANLVAAQVSTTPEFALRGSQVLFSAAPYIMTAVSRRNYDVSADGRRFLMVRPAGADAGVRLVVVENWFEELKTRKPQ